MIESKTQATEYQIGERVKIARVKFAGNPNHDKMVGLTGTIKKIVKSRNVVALALDNGGSWEASPENLELAPAAEKTAHSPATKAIGVGARYDDNLNAFIIITDGWDGPKTEVPASVALAANDLLAAAKAYLADIVAADAYKREPHRWTCDEAQARGECNCALKAFKAAISRAEAR